MARYCNRCRRKMVDPKTGEPDMRRHTCDPECARADRAEKMRLKRRREREERTRRVAYALREKCAACLQRSAGGTTAEIAAAKYSIIYEETASGYSAHVPELPGCVAAGKSFRATAHLIHAAIELHLEGAAKDGRQPLDAIVRPAAASLQPAAGAPKIGDLKIGDRGGNRNRKQ